MVPEYHGVLVSWYQSDRMFWLRGIRVPRCFGCVMPEFHDVLIVVYQKSIVVLLFHGTRTSWCLNLMAPKHRGVLHTPQNCHVVHVCN